MRPWANTQVVAMSPSAVLQPQGVLEERGTVDHLDRRRVSKWAILGLVACRPVGDAA